MDLHISSLLINWTSFSFMLIHWYHHLSEIVPLKFPCWNGEVITVTVWSFHEHVQIESKMSCYWGIPLHRWLVVADLILMLTAWPHISHTSSVAALPQLIASMSPKKIWSLNNVVINIYNVYYRVAYVQISTGYAGWSLCYKGLR